MGKKYEKFGAKGLQSKKNKETYPVQFKLDVLTFMKRTGSSVSKLRGYLEGKSSL